MQDANLVLQASVAKTASFNSTGISLPTGTPRRGLKARVLVTAISGTNTAAVFTIEHSADNNTFNTLATCLTASVTAVGEYFIPFETSQPYVRLAMVGTSDTSVGITYQGAVLLARP